MRTLKLTTAAMCLGFAFGVMALNQSAGAVVCDKTKIGPCIMAGMDSFPCQDTKTKKIYTPKQCTKALQDSCKASAGC